MKFFYLYKITNQINGKIYIGVRSSTKHPYDDPYMGSGKRLKDAMKHYGRGAFTKVVLETFDSMELAFLREAEIVDQAFVDRPDTYNICLGGFGGDHWSYLSSREELINKRRATKQQHDASLTSEERRKKYGRQHWIGREHTETTKGLLSELNGTWLYTCISPEGQVYEFSGLRKFCSDHRLNADIFRKFANTNKPIPLPHRGPINPSRVNSSGWVVNRSPKLGHNASTSSTR